MVEDNELLEDDIMNKDKKLINDNIVRIADKPMGNYLTAIAVKMKKFLPDKPVMLTGFGRNLDRTFSIAEKACELYNLRQDKVYSYTEKSGNKEYTGIAIELVYRKKEE